MKIKRITPPRENLHQHLARIYGHSEAPKKAYFENTETGDAYSRLMGGIAWPSPTGNSPGYAVIMAAGRVDNIDEMPTIWALQEAIEDDPARLIDRCLELRKEWGFSKSQDLLVWRGDHERCLPIWTEINSRLMRRDGSASGFIVTPPIDFQVPDRFERYVQSLRRTLLSNKDGRTIFQPGQCDTLRLALKNAPPDVVKRGPEEFPVLACAGGLVHSLMTTKIWLEGVEKERLKPTTPYDIEQRAFLGGEDDWNSLWPGDEEEDF